MGLLILGPSPGFFSFQFFVGLLVLVVAVFVFVGSNSYALVFVLSYLTITP